MTYNSAMASESPETPPAAPHVEREREEVVVLFPTLGRLLRSCLPDETVRHLRAARREQLLAFRSLLDARIARLDRAQAESDARRARRHTSPPPPTVGV
jgi:hypothetical protein